MIEGDLLGCRDSGVRTSLELERAFQPNALVYILLLQSEPHASSLSSSTHRPPILLFSMRFASPVKTILPSGFACVTVAFQASISTAFHIAFPSLVTVLTSLICQQNDQESHSLRHMSCCHRRPLFSSLLASMLIQNFTRLARPLLLRPISSTHQTYEELWTSFGVAFLPSSRVLGPFNI